jgi:hypothetical protein
VTPPARRRSRTAIRVLGLAVAVFAGFAVATARPGHTAPLRDSARELARSDFDRGLDGWRGYRATVRVLEQGRAAAEVRLATSRRGAPSFSIFRAFAGDGIGTSYESSAVVRGAQGAALCLRIREGALDARGRCVRATGGWQVLGPVSYVQRRDRTVSVAVLQLGTRRSRRFRVDRVTVFQRPRDCTKHGCTTTGTTTAPTTATTTTTTPPPTTTTTTTTPPPPPPPPPPPTSADPANAGVGAQFHCAWSFYTNADRTAVLDKLKAAGVSWVRIDMAWAGIEDTKKDARNAWYLGMMDFCIDQARARGLNVLVTLWMTPGWANGGRSYYVPPANPADYADFARWAAARWAGRVAAWEVWNEPDPNQSFWQGTTDQYVGLLRAAYPAFKAGDPSAKVVLGGPSSNDDGWLAQLYALGAKGTFDVAATHPYQGLADAAPETPDDGHRWWFTHVVAVRNVMVANGDGAKPIWFTEFGWSAHPNWVGIAPWQRGVTLDQQADYLVRAVKFTRANYPYVGVMFWYKERANPTGTDPHEEGFALLNADLSERPALAALRAYLTG